MSLRLMYITNNPDVALIAEKNGVDRVWIDLETLGKEERQKGMNTVKSNHKISDIAVLSKVLTKSELLVRTNPWNENSVEEIEKVISAGANRIMLPMWKSLSEVDCFLRTINKRVSTTLLLETKEAVECLDEVLLHPLLDEIHIGLNDLHLSYGLTFLFEPLSSGMVEKLSKKMKDAGVSFGFGGIAKIGEGMLPAERVIMEHYRLGSTRAILSRSFCNAEEITDLAEVEEVFSKNMKLLREYEKNIVNFSDSDFEQNKIKVASDVASIVSKIKGSKNA